MAFRRVCPALNDAARLRPKTSRKYFPAWLFLAKGSKKLLAFEQIFRHTGH